MKQIMAVFRRDLGRIGRNAMALIVAVGVGVLPALYAWFNIAANWDPYGSTGGIQVAVASEDRGCTIQGASVNIGDNIVAELKGNDQIGWRFVDARAAVDGVQSGRYYAAIVIPADFSQKLSSILTSDIQRPTIDYYINEKKNAIAPKITDKGVDTVQQQVNETFTDVATQAIVAGLATATGDLDRDSTDLADRFLDRLREADRTLGQVGGAIDVFCHAADAVDELTAGSRALLPDANGTLDQANAANDSLGDLLAASRDSAKGAVAGVDGIIDAALDAFDTSGAQLLDLLDRVDSVDFQTDADGLQHTLRALHDELEGAAGQLGDAAEQLEAQRAEADAQAAIDALNNLKAGLLSLQSVVDKAAEQAGAAAGALAPGAPLRQELEEAGLRAAALSRDTIAPALAQKERQLADTNPGGDPAKFTPQQKQLLAEIAALRAAQSAADLTSAALGPAALDGLRGDALDVQTKLKDLSANLTRTSGDLERVKELVGRLPGAAQDLTDGLDSASSLSGTLAQLARQAADLAAKGQPLPDGLRDRAAELIATVDRDAAAARTAAKGAQPQMDAAVDQAFRTLESVSGLLTQFSGALPQVSGVLDHMDGAMDAASRALVVTGGLIRDARQDVEDLIGQLESVDGDERLQKFTDILENDASAMGGFMSAPVRVESHSFYPIKNYGSAMAAFYSILACWVGGVVLVAILKVGVDEDQRVSGLKPWEAYLGRYLLFLLFGLVQSTIICLGDIYFLGVQCTSVPLFLLAGWTASFVFTLIIYTLTVSFGDVGKALAVILLVIQIAGSGGTFPIEVTPRFFQGVYPFLPFTHGINALREIIAGQYALAYWTDLLKLLAFVPLALLLGLVLRKPLIRMNEFFQDRLESTHLM